MVAGDATTAAPAAAAPSVAPTAAAAAAQEMITGGEDAWGVDELRVGVETTFGATGVAAEVAAEVAMLGVATPMEAGVGSSTGVLAWEVVTPREEGEGTGRVETGGPVVLLEGGRFSGIGVEW